MKILLDENFPLPLYHRLRSEGADVEHIIVLGKRGLPDSEIRGRLAEEELLFLTQDNEFEAIASGSRGTVVISRVPQNLPIQQRVDIWSRAIQAFLLSRPSGKLFELVETGAIIPLEVR